MKRAILLNIAVFAALYCLGQPKAHREDSLLVAPFATHVHYGVFNGQDQLTYTVQESYPATDVLAFISAKLKERGWKPLQDDFLNPKTPSSHVRGWTEFDDAALTPEQRVSQWMAQWENDKHEVVSYTLQYRYPAKETDQEPEHHMRTLHVLAIHIPANIAARFKYKQE